MSFPRFKTEGGGLVAALTMRCYYTHKNLHATDGSRSAISTGPTNGAWMCYDPFGHDEGVGVDVTQPEDSSEADNLGASAGYVVGLRGTLSEASWINVIPPVRGTVGNPLCKANASVATPTFLKPVSGAWELGAATVDGTTPKDELILVGQALETANTSTTAARKPVAFQ